MLLAICVHFLTFLKQLITLILRYNPQYGIRHSNTTLTGQRIFKQNGEREADNHGFVVDVVKRTPIKINRGRTRILRGRKEKIQR